VTHSTLTTKECEMAMEKRDEKWKKNEGKFREQIERD